LFPKIASALCTQRNLFPTSVVYDDKPILVAKVQIIFVNVSPKMKKVGKSLEDKQILSKEIH